MSGAEWGEEVEGMRAEGGGDGEMLVQAEGKFRESNAQLITMEPTLRSCYEGRAFAFPPSQRQNGHHVMEDVDLPYCDHYVTVQTCIESSRRLR